MEETREPQQPATPQIVYQPPPAYPAQQTYYYPPAPAPTVGRFGRFRRLTRLLLRRLLYGAVVAGRVLRPYAVFVVAIVALLGVLGWMSFMLWGPKDTAAVFNRADSLPPALAVENFIKGQQNYNADLMWESYSPNYQASQLANGASKATLQAQANNQRSRGLQFVHYDYIGGVKVDEGSMYFYSVDLQQNSQKARLPMVLLADADGKIIGIDLPLNGSNSSSSGGTQ